MIFCMRNYVYIKNQEKKNIERGKKREATEFDEWGSSFYEQCLCDMYVTFFFSFEENMYVTCHILLSLVGFHFPHSPSGNNMKVFERTKQAES